MHTNKIVLQKFYTNEDVVTIAQMLLGKVIATNKDGLKTSGIIVETEAYKAPDDKASHAYNFRRSPKNETMYADAGTAYVYKCYGIHDMVNVVTGPKNTPHAILIRAIEPVEGLDIMQERRSCKFNNHLLTGGPGKVCQSLGINVFEDDGSLLYNRNNSITIFEGNDVSDIKAGLRVGMSHHTGQSAYLPWRFYIAKNKWVSKPLEVKYDF